jgi:hypothetical protein
MRLFVTVTALALALLPAAAFAQNPPAQQQPPATPAAQTPATPAQPPAPKLTISSPAAILLVQIKPDQTAVFEEMVAKLRAGLASTQDATLKQQAAGLKIYKSAEPFGANALYIIQIEPAVPNAEYELFQMLTKTMTPEQLRAPETAEMWKKFSNAFAAGLSRLSLTPVQ